MHPDPCEPSESLHQRRIRRLAEALEAAGPAAGPPFPCPYLPGRTARQVTVVPGGLGPGVYHCLMDLNFRRLGTAFYRPECGGCAECRMIRVPAAEFRWSRAQRRCWARNGDLAVEIAVPAATEEKRRLYQRYLQARHDGQMDGSDQEFRGFLYTSPLLTLEFQYRLEGRLLAVGIADLEPRAMSAVYCYFEPDAGARSLGVFNVLRMLEECRRRGVPHLYLGYYVAACRRMSYKGQYRPSEIRGADGRWQRQP